MTTETQFPQRIRDLLAAYAANPSEYGDGTPMQADAAMALAWIEANTPKPCKHSYMAFGTEQPRLRCANCNQLQPLDEALPTSSV